MGEKSVSRFLGIKILFWFSAVAYALYQLWLAYPSSVPWLEDWRGLHRTGFIARTSLDENGSLKKHLVFVPYVSPKDKKLPVLLFLNGGGEMGDNGIRQIANNLGFPIWEMKGRFPFLMVAPQCSLGGHWSEDSDDTRMAMRALDKAIRDYNGDPDRVFVTGPSAGGGGTYAFATAFPDRFAGIVPMAGVSTGTPPEKIAKVLAKAKMSIWSFYNQRDATPTVVEFNESIRACCVREGLSPNYTSPERAGHDSWNNYRNPALYDWMLRQSRSQNASCELFKPLVYESLVDLISESKGAWSLAEPGILTFMPSETSSRSDRDLLVWNSKGKDFDFDFDYRCEVDVPLKMVLRNETKKSPENWIELTIAKSGIESGGIVSSDDQWLAIADPIAEITFLTKAWNLIRMHRDGRNLTVRVNERELISCELDELGDDRFSVCLVGSNKSQRWRELRVREGTNKSSGYVGMKQVLGTDQ